jgi:sec-independent protein translocase protein TatA
MFGNIGFPELLIILAIALLIFGPKKLPEVSKSLGRAIREFRRTSDEIKDKIEQEIQASDFKDIKNELKKDLSQGIYKEDKEVPEEKEEKKDEEGQKIS